MIFKMVSDGFKSDHLWFCLMNYMILVWFDIGWIWENFICWAV